MIRTKTLYKHRMFKGRNYTERGRKIEYIRWECLQEKYLWASYKDTKQTFWNKRECKTPFPEGFCQLSSDSTTKWGLSGGSKFRQTSSNSVRGLRRGSKFCTLRMQNIPLPTFSFGDENGLVFFWKWCKITLQKQIFF